MAWTGSAPNQVFTRTNGVHTGATVWQQDEAAATGVVADRHDTHDADITTGLNLALLKNGGNTLTASIPAGGFGMTGTGVLSTATEVNVTAASTSDVLSQASLQVLCTGSGATITSLGTTAKVARKRVRFDGANTLTHNATTLILPGAANITTASGDRMEVESDASGNARVTWYQKADGRALVVSVLGAALASFRVSKSASQSISSSAETAVTWNTEQFDIGSLFASNGWTPPAGKVALGGAIRFTAVSSGESLVVRVMKDAALFAEFASLSSSNTTDDTVSFFTVDAASGSNVYTVSVLSSDGTYSVVGVQTYYSHFFGYMI